MRYILERFEEEWAMIECSYGEDISFQQLPRKELPENAKEGDVLQRTDSGWQIDEAETKERRAVMEKRLRALGLC